MTLRSIIGFLMILFALQNCTVKKRAYQKGYYVDWAKSKANEKKTVTEAAAEPQPEKPEIVVVGPEIKTAEPSANTTTDVDQLSAHNSVQLRTDTCGDKMILKNAEQLLVKVLEIGEEQIKYKRCDNFDGPVYSIGKEKVSHIVYVNGFKEIIEPPVKKQMQNVVYTGERDYPSELIWGTVFPFVLSAIGVVISIFQLFKAKRKIRNNPTRYKGMNLADFMLTFDFAAIGFGILMMFVLLGNLSAGLFYVALIGWLVVIAAAAIFFGTRK